ncbi:hypothetical protein K491DRAFT_758767 [Lophiostoma macrostomum CBS 122681]|uniref:Zn(2)-C6 fungal-type domain-containing protein n=1 Tax=Lophiostoma macrostomum CBS 122681 TaxID=1314788 RepID=A0A6A6T3K5_9PLEO|nr:hypothetical protein K491DRAFT_758767 [Lophiostoma macrostomum CBS 122681]
MCLTVSRFHEVMSGESRIRPATHVSFAVRDLHTFDTLFSLELGLVVASIHNSRKSLRGFQISCFDYAPGAMPNSASAADSSATTPQAKRMRLGTKSCAECRRRKVRCILIPGERICEACAVHGVTCVPQEGTRKRQSGAAGLLSPAPTGSDQSDTGLLHKRLAHLESVLDRMVDAQDRHTSASSPEIRSLREESFSASREPEGSSYDGGDADLDNAPFSHLWKDVITIQPVTASGQAHGRQLPFPPARAKQPLLPSAEVLAQVLSHTEKLWPIWTCCTFDTTGMKRLQPGDLQQNASIVMEAIAAQDSIITPKAYLFLVLCLSHVPHNHGLLLSLPRPPAALIQQYQAHAQFLLDSSHDTVLSSHTLVCLSLQWRIALDAGKPLAAWRLLRSAITLAIQLGYHQTSTGYNDTIEKATWTALWQTERTVSCMLGLPSCTSNQHVGCRPSDLNPEHASELEVVHHKLSIIAGDIIERDQDRMGAAKEENYPTTPLVLNPRATDTHVSLGASVRRDVLLCMDRDACAHDPEVAAYAVHASLEQRYTSYFATLLLPAQLYAHRGSRSKDYLHVQRLPQCVSGLSV